MKAVIWTDTIQVFIMYASMIAVIAKGHFDVGGSEAVWRKNMDSGRVEFIEYIFCFYFEWVSIFSLSRMLILED